MIQIAKWSEAFESADTRKRQRLGWFLCPSGCDSRGFRKLMRMGDDGLIALGVFQALCQAMATQGIESRKAGTFQNSDGSPMDFEDILEVSRLGGRLVADWWQIIGRLVAVGWIVCDNPLVSQDNAGSLPVPCRSSAGSLPQGEGEGQGKGQEKEKGEERKPNPSRYGTFEQVKAMAMSGAVPVTMECAEMFFDRMEEIGWVDDKGLPLADWRARFRRYVSHWNSNAQRNR